MQIVLKSLFDHPEHEIYSKKPAVVAESQRQQASILKKEFENLKLSVQPAPPVDKGSHRSGSSIRNAEAMENVHELVRGMNKP